MTTKFVIVEHKRFSGRYVAVRGLAFDTRGEAEAYVVAEYREPYRKNFQVEERQVKADDTNERMHCQCCGRAILSKGGVIAHHGYERPGQGWQTRSCYGARHLPWEVDRGVLGLMIDALKNTLARMIEVRAGVAAETIPVTHYYRGPRRTVTGKRDELSITLTRATFDALKAEDAAAKHGDRKLDGYYGDDATFDGFKRRDLASRDRRIEKIDGDIRASQARYDGWKQTHKRDGDLWITLAPEVTS